MRRTDNLCDICGKNPIDIWGDIVKEISSGMCQKCFDKHKDRKVWIVKQKHILSSKSQRFLEDICDEAERTEPYYTKTIFLDERHAFAYENEGTLIRIFSSKLEKEVDVEEFIKIVKNGSVSILDNF